MDEPVSDGMAHVVPSRWTGSLLALWESNETIDADARAEMLTALLTRGEFAIDCGPGPMVVVRVVSL